MNIEIYTKELEDKGRFVQDVNFENSPVEINQLKQQNLFLKQLIAQLSHENQSLKKRLFSTGKTEITKDKCA